MFVIIAHSPRAVCDNGDMCGIAGFVAAGQGDAAFKAVGAMVGALRRRGPDQERIEIWPDAVLGHRRLAILALSPAGGGDRSAGSTGVSRIRLRYRGAHYIQGSAESGASDNCGVESGTAGGALLLEAAGGKRLLADRVPGSGGGDRAAAAGGGSVA